MKTISVPLHKHSYPIWIDYGLLNNVSDILEPLNNGQVWVLFSQQKIYNEYGQALCESFRSHNYNIEYILLEDGEKTKSFQHMEKLYSQLLLFGCDRSSKFIALGGGVVGDITGFLAATFMRGVEYIQIPTTLLGMVDSSIGGKTAINLNEGKNLVGAFWQPKTVIIDPEVLTTLPDREFYSAMGEVIKYGAILDRKLFNQISNNIDSILLSKKSTLIFEMIIRCAELKVNVVTKDEKEIDERRILNFGHTVGHALEIFYGFEKLRHGEAIAYGMLAAGFLSVKKSYLTNQDYKLLRDLILKLPLPKLNDFTPKKIFDIMKNDKKVKKRNIHFILLKNIGETIIVNNINKEMVMKSIQSIVL